jgi:hypothetical protein
MSCPAEERRHEQEKNGLAGLCLHLSRLRKFAFVRIEKRHDYSYGTEKLLKDYRTYSYPALNLICDTHCIQRRNFAIQKITHCAFGSNL